MAFRFLRFTVEDKQSTLRVGTDSMLLGSWANPGTAGRILDIGTGCGVLALMMAQKSAAAIDAIDIDMPSVTEAAANFSGSPWPSRITAIHASLQAFSCDATAVYDFIITNPPYFSNSLKSPKVRVNHTRHDESLPLSALARHASHLLTTDGRFTLVLPSDAASRFRKICAGYGLHLSRCLDIYPRPEKLPKRTLMEFTKDRISDPESSSLTILDEPGKFTPEYLALTEGFHNFEHVCRVNTYK